jgi:glyoxylate/hydroxypyruvate reductase A
MPGKEKGRILLAMTGLNPRPWYELLSKHRDVVTEPDGAADPSIAYAVVWKQKPNLLSNLPNLRAIFSVGAGVDHIMDDRSLPDVPIVRVVADNLTQQMTDYVLWRVLDHHRQGLAYRAQQKRKVWREMPQRPSSDVAVGIMGLGELGRAAARVLKAAGYHVNGWSRRAQSVEGVTTFDGDKGLTPFLNATDILVVLLPLTPQTSGVVNYGLLKQLRKRNAIGGAVLINAGRGRLQKDADILKALGPRHLSPASQGRGNRRAASR